MQVNIYEGKTNFSKLINKLINKEEKSIDVCKNGVLVARIIPVSETKERRLGIAKGKWKDMSIDEFNSYDVSDLF